MHNQTEVAVENPTATTPSETQLEQLYPDEMKRWILLLGTPMLAACVCIGLAFGTRLHWFYAGAIAFGPGLGVLAIIYLAISSDTNGTTSSKDLADPLRHLEPAQTAVAA